MNSNKGRIDRDRSLHICQIHALQSVLNSLVLAAQSSHVPVWPWTGGFKRDCLLLSLTLQLADVLSASTSKDRYHNP